MSSFHCLGLAVAVLMFSINHPTVAQPLGVNPSAAASDVRNPSSINPSAAASDVRNPSATNPSAATSQIPQPTAVSPSRTNLSPPMATQRIGPAPQRARAVRRAKSRRAAAVEMTRPFEALEGARRERIELEKRIAQENAKQLRAEREQKDKEAAQAEGERKRGAPLSSPVQTR
jgi:hypothetical protein